MGKEATTVQQRVKKTGSMGGGSPEKNLTAASATLAAYLLKIKQKKKVRNGITICISVKDR